MKLGLTPLYNGVEFVGAPPSGWAIADKLKIMRTGAIHRELAATTGTTYYVDSVGKDGGDFTGNPLKSIDYPAQGEFLNVSGNSISLNTVKANDNFTEYLIFHWDIDIPLKSIDWNWSAEAHANNSWSVQNPVYPNFVLHDNPDFPTWTNSVDPIHITSQSP